LDAVARLAALRDRLSREDRLLVAFSGGVDSALLASSRPSSWGGLGGGDRGLGQPARRRAGRRPPVRPRARAGHVEVCTDELDRPEYRANGGDRCFHCKSALLDALAPLAAQSGAAIALGTNLDDLGDHRPGQRAAAARGAVAPLVDARLGKDAVRAVSGLLGLATTAKPAAACLSSRVAYGDPVTPEVLARIERAEAALHALGFPVCRVRAHAGGTVARLGVCRR